MRSLLARFRPAPAIALIEDEGQRAQQYRYWRTRILYATFVGYALYYFTRGTLAIAMPELKRLGYDEAMLGWLLTLFQLSYGVSKFGNGILADQSNPRYLMALGLIMTGLLCIGFGFSGSLLLFIVLWTLHGWFQGCGSAPCHRLMAHWFAPRERGRWYAIWNSSHNVGAALLPLLGAYLLTRYGWSSVMFVPGVIAILGGLFLINRLRDTPQSLGLPPVEAYRGEGAPVHAEVELSTREILERYILRNPALWMLSLTYFMVYVVRWTLSHWCFYYLVELRQQAPLVAAQSVWWYEIGGLCGGLAAGWLSDVFFRGRRTSVHLIFLSGVLASVTAFQYCESVGMTQLLMGLLGIFIYGPQMLLAVHAIELTHKNASATAIGFLGIIAYVGAAMTGGPLGHLVKHGGWDSVFLLMQVCTAIGMLGAALLYRLPQTRRGLA